jgi:aspartate/methionine/tyrosine aminotransferase
VIVNLPHNPTGMRLVRDQGVLLLPGRVCDYGDGRFRLGFGRVNLPEAVERLDRQLRS